MALPQCLVASRRWFCAGSVRLPRKTTSPEADARRGTRGKKAARSCQPSGEEEHARAAAVVTGQVPCAGVGGDGRQPSRSGACGVFRIQRDRLRIRPRLAAPQLRADQPRRRPRRDTSNIMIFLGGRLGGLDSHLI